MPITSRSAASGWLVLLAGPPPEIRLLANHVGSPEIRIVRTAGFFFLKAAELDGLMDSRAVEWAAAALLEELDFAARLRLGGIYPVRCGGTIAVQADGTWDQQAVDGAVDSIKFYVRPVPSEGSTRSWRLKHHAWSNQEKISIGRHMLPSMTARRDQFLATSHWRQRACRAKAPEEVCP